MTFNWNSSTGVLAALLAMGLVGACGSDEKKADATDGGGDATTGAGGSAGGGRTGAGGRSNGGASSGGASGGGAAGAAACTIAAGTTCDGAEDCAAGEHCCGLYESNAYHEFRCTASCEALNADGGMTMAGPLWLELCHAGDTCENGDPCQTSTYLPEPLSRCFTSGSAAPTTAPKVAGEVNCGTGTCGSGEQCCIRQPLAPYCAPAGATCDCDFTGPPADAGGDAAPTDAGRDAAPDAPPPADAASDASSPPLDAPASG